MTEPQMPEPLDQRILPDSALAAIPEDLAREYLVIAVAATPEQWTVARPPEGCSADLPYILGRNIVWEVHPREAILRAIMRHYTFASVATCGWRLRFQCPQQWRRLVATDRPGVRFCPVCTTDVYLCVNDAEVVEQARQGHCVAFEPGFGAVSTAGLPGLDEFPG